MSAVADITVITDDTDVPISSAPDYTDTSIESSEGTPLDLETNDTLSQARLREREESLRKFGIAFESSESCPSTQDEQEPHVRHHERAEVTQEWPSLPHRMKDYSLSEGSCQESVDVVSGNADRPSLTLTEPVCEVNRFSFGRGDDEALSSGNQDNDPMLSVSMQVDRRSLEPLARKTSMPLLRSHRSSSRTHTRHSPDVRHSPIESPNSPRGSQSRNSEPPTVIRRTLPDVATITSQTSLALTPSRQRYSSLDPVIRPSKSSHVDS